MATDRFMKIDIASYAWGATQAASLSGGNAEIQMGSDVKGNIATA